MANPTLCSSSVVKVKLGTWQSTQGRHWDDGGRYTGIRSITVVHSNFGGVSTIQVEYDLFGKPVLGEEHHGTAWASRKDVFRRKEKVILDFPSEFLIAVIYNHDSKGKLRDLYFETNKRTIGTSGDAAAWPTPPRRLQCSVDGGTGAIVGFFGLADEQHINSIGLYIAVLCPTADFFDKMQEQGFMPYRTSPLSTPSPSSAM